MLPYPYRQHCSKIQKGLEKKFLVIDFLEC